MVIGLIHDAPTVRELISRIMSEWESIIRGRFGLFLHGRFASMPSSVSPRQPERIQLVEDHLPHAT